MSFLLEGIIEAMETDLQDAVVNHITHGFKMDTIDNRGAINEIIDSATPIYDNEILQCWDYNPLEMRQAGAADSMADPSSDNYQLQCVAAYLSNKAHQWLSDEGKQIAANMEEIESIISNAFSELSEIEAEVDECEADLNPFVIAKIQEQMDAYDFSNFFKA